MILAVLFACTEPPLLESLQGALGDESVEMAEPAIRMWVGDGGLIAETCGVEPLGGYVFGGASAVALGATTGVFEKDEITGGFSWQQEGIGLDGDTGGTLSIGTDADRDNWNIAGVTGDGDSVSGTISLDCDPDAGKALVSGAANHETDDFSATVGLLGKAPEIGLLFEPTTARAPDSGFVKWTREDDGRQILLEDASAIDAVADEWPGLATGKGWQHKVIVRLP